MCEDLSLGALISEDDKQEFVAKQISKYQQASKNIIKNETREQTEKENLLVNENDDES